MGNVHFSTKPRHVTPQIDCLVRSFICNTKTPSVKQSVKQQVSSNFQI